MKLLGRLLAVALVVALPWLLVISAGVLWLYERGYLVAWAISAAVLVLLGKLCVYWFNQRSRQQSPAGLQPSADWAPAAEPAWQRVVALSAEVRREDWPWEDPQQWQALLVRVLEAVAREYHPGSQNPVLEVPLTHITKIVELVARDLGEAAAEKLPGSHLLTVNDLAKLSEWAKHAGFASTVAFNLFRIVRFFSGDPTSVLFRELQGKLSGKLFNETAAQAKDYLLDFVVCRAGFYAIELYSGKLVSDPHYVTQQTRRDLAQAGEQSSQPVEPLRMLVIGQVNAGKSSLLNALFGELKSAVDILPTTRQVTPYVLERAGLPQALIFDTVGYDSATSTSDRFAELGDHLLRCDLILLVCSATTAARAGDRQVLDELRGHFSRHADRRLPLIVAVLTHIDQLRPFREWNPPYDLSTPTTDKARQIQAAVTQVAAELELPTDHVVPVCLLPERVYGVDEALLPALLEWLPEASRVKALRCLAAQRTDEQWRQLWHQAASGGRFVLSKAWSALRGDKS